MKRSCGLKKLNFLLTISRSQSSKIQYSHTPIRLLCLSETLTRQTSVSEQTIHKLVQTASSTKLLTRLVFVRQARRNGRWYSGNAWPSSGRLLTNFIATCMARSLWCDQTIVLCLRCVLSQDANLELLDGFLSFSNTITRLFTGLVLLIWTLMHFRVIHSTQCLFNQIVPK